MKNLFFVTIKQSEKPSLTNKALGSAGPLDLMPVLSTVCVEVITLASSLLPA